MKGKGAMVYTPITCHRVLTTNLREADVTCGGMVTAYGIPGSAFTWGLLFLETQENG